MSALRTWLAAATVLTAAAVLATRPSLGAAAVAGGVVIGTGLAALWVEGFFAMLPLGLLVVETALVGRHESSAAQALLALVVTVVLWTLHSGHALLTARAGTELPREVLERFVRSSALVLVLATPAIVLTGALAFAGRVSTGLVAVRVVGLLAALAVVALPAVLTRRADQATKR